jgi:hypothetical protein
METTGKRHQDAVVLSLPADARGGLPGGKVLTADDLDGGRGIDGGIIGIRGRSVARRHGVLSGGGSASRQAEDERNGE